MRHELDGEVEALLRRTEDAIAGGASDERVTRLLLRLARAATSGSDAWAYAHRQLAARAVATDPWRASLLARRVVACRPRDDGAWGLYALAQSLLGHHRFAVTAYRRAVSLARDNPWYAHNLGHLYDVALDRPDKALPLLRRAYRALPHNHDVLASYAHALARAGDVRRARSLMKRVVQLGAQAEHQALYAWLCECEDASAEQARGRPVQARKHKKRRTTKAARRRRSQ